jgi:hypothetical protein
VSESGDEPLGLDPGGPQEPLGLDPGLGAGDHTDGGAQESPADEDTGAQQPPGLGLDPDRAIAEYGGPRTPRLPPPVIDTRRYQWMIGGFGVLLLVIFSVLLYAHGGSGTPGIPAGHKLPRFVAPLATSDLNLPANAHPHCNPAKPQRQGLNVCNRKPIVLALFAIKAKPCVREVDALQRVAPQFPGVQFAAVAINSDLAQTRKVVRANHWTIQVGFDMTGAIGQVYGVSVCPLVELARPGGVVEQRLIGEGWQKPGTLAAAVRKLVAG